MQRILYDMMMVKLKTKDGDKTQRYGGLQLAR